jgi:hypothetical protein
MTITVWIMEEYGYRYWRWATGMTSDQLCAFWASIPAINMDFLSSKHLPGKLIQLDWGNWKKVAYRQNGERFEFEERPTIWKAHVHEDVDSWLARADGEVIHHAGWKPQIPSDNT